MIALLGDRWKRNHIVVGQGSTMWPGHWTSRTNWSGIVHMVLQGAAEGVGNRRTQYSAGNTTKESVLMVQIAGLNIIAALVKRQIMELEFALLPKRTRIKKKNI